MSWAPSSGTYLPQYIRDSGLVKVDRLLAKWNRAERLSQGGKIGLAIQANSERMLRSVAHGSATHTTDFSLASIMFSRSKTPFWQVLE